MPTGSMTFRTDRAQCSQRVICAVPRFRKLFGRHHQPSDYPIVTVAPPPTADISPIAAWTQENEHAPLNRRGERTPTIAALALRANIAQNQTLMIRRRVFFLLAIRWAAAENLLHCSATSARL